MDNLEWLEGVSNDAKPKSKKTTAANGKSKKAKNKEIDSDELQEKMRGDAYYTDRTAFSNSMFKKLEDDEVEFHKWYTEQTVDPVNPIFSNGQYLHDYMARKIDADYKSECEFLVMPKLDMRTKAGKEKYAELTAGVDTDKVYTINEDDVAKIEALADSFLESEWFKSINRVAQVAVEKAYMREKNGLMLKGKLDYEAMLGDERLIIDWKTSSNYSDFSKKAYYYGYNRQAACYDYIANADRFIFVVFDIVTFKRWKIVEVDKKGVFYFSGLKKLNESIETAKDYLANGISSERFKHETL